MLRVAPHALDSAASLFVVVIFFPRWTDDDNGEMSVAVASSIKLTVSNVTNRNCVK